MQGCGGTLFEGQAAGKASAEESPSCHGQTALVTFFNTNNPFPWASRGLDGMLPREAACAAPFRTRCETSPAFAPLEERESLVRLGLLAFCDVRDVHATLRSTRLVLLPPNPNEFETTTRTSASILWCRTWHSSCSGLSRLIVGGIA